MEVRRREEARAKTGQPDLTANVSIFMAATVRYLYRPHPHPHPLSTPRPVDVYSELFYMAEGRWKSLRKMNDSLTSSALLRVYPVLQARPGIYDFGVKSRCPISISIPIRLHLWHCNKRQQQSVVLI